MVEPVCHNGVDEPVTAPMADEITAPDASEVEAAEGEPVVPSGPALRSDRIGRYVVLSKLGAGGMGVVYSAFDEGLARRVAVKLLFPERAHEEHARRRFEREAQVLARLSHPNVVQIYEVGEHEGAIFMAMELVQGISLAEWISAGPRPWREVVGCYLQAARGLQAAHEAGILHRDFKPANVILGDDGRVRVLDFGLARTVDEFEALPSDSLELAKIYKTADEDLTATGSVLGTPAYMAPEQLRGLPAEPTSDVFSFCTALYEALYGERPHPGKTSYARMFSIISGPKAPPADIHVPAAVARIVMQGLSAKPEDRPASMQALIDVLEADPRRRRRQWVMAAVTLGVAGMAALGTSMLDRQPQPCEGFEDRLEGVWDETRRVEVTRAFEESGSAYAGEVGPQVVALLDRRAEALVQGMRDACMATHVIGGQSAERLDRRMACLDDRLRPLRELTEQLRQADEATVALAEEAVRRLPDPALCADFEVLDMVLPPPPDEASRQRIGEVRDALARADALLSTGRSGDAQPIVEEARRDAESIGYVPLTLEADLLRADVEESLGDFRAARRTLERVIDGAEASRHDQVLAKAWFRLVDLGVHGLEDPDTASWFRRAEATATRAKISSYYRIELAGLRAWWAVEQGDFELARQQIDHGLALRREAGEDTSDTSLGPNFDHARANLALREGRYEQAGAIWERQLRRYRTAYPDGNPNIPTIHYNLGLIASKLGDLEGAREHYERAEGLWSSTRGGPHWKRGMARMGLGLVARRTGDPAAARDHLDAAIDMVRAHGGPKLGEVFVERGISAFNEGELEQAIHFYRQGLELFENAYGEGAHRVGITWFNIGEAHLELGQLERADAPLETAVAILERTTDADDPELLGPYQLLGQLRLSQRRPREAIQPLSRARALCRPAESSRCRELAAELAIARWYRDPDQAKRLVDELGPLDEDADLLGALTTKWPLHHHVMVELGLAEPTQE